MYPGIDPTFKGPVKEALDTLLLDRRDSTGPKPTAAGTRLRASMARDCARRIAFNVLGVQPVVELNTATLAAFDIGDTWHALLQESLVNHYGAEVEATVDMRPLLDLSGSADAILTFGQNKCVVEIKSMKAYAWNLAINGDPKTGTGPGPKIEHLAQAGLYAKAAGANHVLMVYCNKDSAELAEWFIGMTDELPHLPRSPRLAEIVDEEIFRLSQLLGVVESGFLPARIIPGHGVVEAPPSAEDRRRPPWNCRYCQFQPVCVGLPTGAVPIESVVAIKVDRSDK